MDEVNENQNNSTGEINEVNNPVRPQTPVMPLQLKNIVSRLGKVKFFIIIFIIAIIIGGIVYFLSVIKSSSKNAQKTSLPEKSVTDKAQVTTFQSLRLFNLNLGDSDSNFFFSDGGKVYLKKMDGTPVTEIASFPNNVLEIKTLKNGGLLITVDKRKWDKSLKPDEPNYKLIVDALDYWILMPDTKKPEKIDETKYNLMNNANTYTNGQRIYANVLTNGSANIMVDKFDGSPAAKIGFMKKNISNEFIPSTNGSYMINKPQGGGGLGTPGIVISRDGSRVYNIDFYWYGTSAIWIGDNKLIKEKEGKHQIVTFKEDGTFTDTPFINDFGGSFSQDTLSPSGKLLFVINDLDKTFIYDLLQSKIIPIESASNMKLRKIYSLKPSDRLYIYYGFIAWNEKSDKVMYSSTAVIRRAEKHDSYSEKTMDEEIKVFDLKTGNTSTVATLDPMPEDQDAVMLKGRPHSSINHLGFW